MSLTAIHESNFEAEVLQSDKLSIVTFWAIWCAPCRLFEGMLEAYASENDHIKISKVDIDEEEGLQARYEVIKIPTTLIFKDGEVIDRLDSALCKETVVERVKYHSQLSQPS